jgi:protein-tyrosine-phosphatase
MVEFKLDAGGRYWLMEINPRLWGSLAISVDAGVNFPLGLLQIACGEQPAAQPQYKLRYTRDLLTDIEWLKANLQADPQDPLLLTRSRSFSLLELLRPLTGRESWDHFDWRDLGVTRRILALAVSSQLHPLSRRIKNWRRHQRLLRHHRALVQRLAASGQPKKIIFVCYGNICRSPLAAALAQQTFTGVDIESAGFHDQTGRSCPEKIQRIGAAWGADLSQHRSARVTGERLRGADLVIAMDLDNMQRLKREFPDVLARTTLLGLFADPPAAAIADPYNTDDVTTSRICLQVRSGIDGLAQCFAHATALPYTREVTAAHRAH